MARHRQAGDGMNGARLDLPSRPATCRDQLRAEGLEPLSVRQRIEGQPHIPALVLLCQAIPQAILSKSPSLPPCRLGDQCMDRVDAAGVDVEWEQVRAAFYGRS